MSIKPDLPAPRTNLILGFTAEQRAALEADLLEGRPDLAGDPQGIDDALQALATLGLYDRLDAGRAQTAAARVAEALEAINIETRNQIATRTQTRRQVTDPYAHRPEQQTPLS